MSLNYVTLSLDLYDGSGNLITEGTVEFVPSVQLTDAGVQFTPLAPIRAALKSEIAGVPVTVKLLATDNSGPLPSGWGWTAKFSSVPGSPASFTFFLPFSGGASQALSSQAPVLSATAFVGYLQITNNLSDVASPSAARTNLGLAYDTSAGDIAPTATAAVAGAVGKVADSGHVHKQNYLGLFGDGSDGAVTLDGTATFPAFATTTGVAPNLVYTLTRDVYATSFTLNSGVTLKHANLRIFCMGTLTLNGSVLFAANNASGTNQGTGGTSPTSGTVQGGQGGANGTTGVGAQGAASNGNAGTGTAGGGGASGASGGNNAGGAGNAAKTPSWPLHNVMSGFAGIMYAHATGNVVTVSGANGGSSGGGDGANVGGGGGSGGNSIWLYAWNIIIGATANLNAQGGIGGTPTTGNCGGGGGGGGGNIIGYTLTPWTLSGTTVVTPGAPGSGVGTGSAGSAGTSGTVLNVVVA